MELKTGPPLTGKQVAAFFLWTFIWLALVVSTGGDLFELIMFTMVWSVVGGLAAFFYFISKPPEEGEIIEISSQTPTRELEEMDPVEFEHLVADIWQQKGWTTSVTSESGDRGIDVVARKKDPYDQKIVIQAKNYSDGNKVGSKEIQQYASLKQQEENVDQVVVATTSTFTKQAEEIADNLNVKLVDRQNLEEMMDSPS